MWSTPVPRPASPAWGMFIDKSTICDGTTWFRHHFRPGVHQWIMELWHRQIYIYGHGRKRESQRGLPERQLASRSQVPQVTALRPLSNRVSTWDNRLFLLPTNDFNQQRAVLDGKGTAGQPSPSDLNSTLRDAKGNPYPNSSTKPSQRCIFAIFSGWQRQRAPLQVAASWWKAMPQSY